MKHLHKFLFYGGLLTVSVVLLIFVWHTVVAVELEKRYYRQNPRIQLAEHAQYLKNVEFQGKRQRILSIITPAIVFSMALIFVIAVSRSKIKKASVHKYKIGQASEIIVHERDLSIAAPVAMGLVGAEQMQHANAGSEQAFTWTERFLELNADYVKHLTTRQALQSGTAQHPALTGAEPLVFDDTHIPTFRQLVERGEIAPGRPMILGFDHGVARRGSFLDIYSAAVAGESGSGKTATLLFLIGSALMSMPVRFIGIDPHYPHPKSLGAKTKPLWDAGLMIMATYKDDMLKMLKEIDQIIQRRLKQVDVDTTPVVLVIDELAFLSTTSIGPEIAQTMERISMEGRKCAVYMLASSQTWLTAKTGGSSSVRDTLTSAFVHRIKPKQANLLLQDKDEASKVKKHVKHAGQALLVPVGDESVVVKMPFTTEADMSYVVGMIGREEFTTQPTKDPKKGVQQSENSQPPNLPTSQPPSSPPPLRERVKMLMSAKQLSYRAIHKETGIALSTLSNFLNNKGSLTPEQIDMLLAYLEQQQPDAKTPVERHEHPFMNAVQPA